MKGRGNARCYCHHTFNNPLLQGMSSLPKYARLEYISCDRGTFLSITNASFAFIFRYTYNHVGISKTIHRILKHFYLFLKMLTVKMNYILQKLSNVLKLRKPKKNLT